jgi:hypothetical protein
VPEVARLYKTDDRYSQLLDYAIALEGLSRHTGVHAAGVVIAPGPLDDYVPILTVSSKGAGAGSDEAVVVTQYDMNCLEKAGMLKMDFLGLTTLTVVTDAVKMIEERSGKRIDLDTLPLDDEETYRVLRAGRTAGVFQFESRSPPTCCGACAATASTTSWRATPSSARARSTRGCTTSTSGASGARSRWRTSSPSWSRSSRAPTASSPTRSR